MITLYLARHGQTVENLSRIFQGHLPGTLTEEGKKQAMDLGESLRNIALDAVVSSDLQRVVDTVQLAVGRPAAALAADYVVEGNRLGTLDRAARGECRFKQSSCWSGNSPDDVRPGRCFLGLSVAAL